MQNDTVPSVKGSSAYSGLLANRTASVQESGLPVRKTSLFSKLQPKLLTFV